MKKSIFYFEDGPISLLDHCDALRIKYYVAIGAHRELLEKPRRQPVDLVIVDLMIHPFGFDEKGVERKNISFEGVHWQRTGLEFIKQLRAGKYKEFGLPAMVPVIVATARTSYPSQEEIEELDVETYLEKPFTIDELEKAVKTALKSRE